VNHSGGNKAEGASGGGGGGDIPAFDVGAEWLRGDGEACDVVLSSRVRLARNLADLPFCNRASTRELGAIVQRCREHVMQAGLASRMIWVDLHHAAQLERTLLMERHLISKLLNKGRTQAGDDPRAVAVSLPDERLAIMVNEEDHLRMQVIRSGLSLSKAWSEIDAVDTALEAKLHFAFSEKLGFLTACPTNVGTGLRMSAMLHLPGLRLTGEIEKVKRAAQDMSLAVRGFYGEGSDAAGDLFQISNQTTLGKSEERILQVLEADILPKVVEYERQARQELLTKRRLGLEDQVFRAWGVLQNARLLTTEESMHALSVVRLGVVLGLFTPQAGVTKPPTIRTINQLVLLVQPAHLQRAVGRELDQEHRRVARATLIRSKLAG
jgi:protein arginine kinase